MKTLKYKEIKQYRESIWKEQEYKCAICKLEIDQAECCLDHQHNTKKETIGENGAGLIRGVLCRNCNSLEGKIWNNSKRYGKFAMLPTFLRNLADYLEKENYPLIHPRSIKKSKK
jgi:hypothetical protein